ncbi:hypothetical protein [Lewinella sp. W8]|uniref:hypothetical protein n=1 Tax=Lewinella sp. W8 TaxID=2528208 RepID=UPI0010673F38|nr:hypothetical protein [Lewinella sp. W8]MTB51480.1 hypothetical protein [Lewinella sp. W8]
MRILIIALALCFFAGCSTAAKVPAAAEAPAKSFAGTWTVSVAGTPLGDVKGDLKIVSTAEGLSGTWTTDGQTLPLSTVRKTEDGLLAVFYFSSYDVDVDIDLTGAETADNLVGVTMGEYRTTAVRKQ